MLRNCIETITRMKYYKKIYYTPINEFGKHYWRLNWKKQILLMVLNEKKFISIL